MFDRDDNIYEGEGLFSTAFHAALYTGAGIGAVSYIRKPEETKNFLKKNVLDRVAPITTPRYSTYEQSVNAFKSGISEAGIIRSSRENISSLMKNEHTLSTMQNSDTKTINIASDMKSFGTVANSDFAYSSFEEIEDSFGNKIGSKIRKSLEELNKKMGSDKMKLNDVKWSGTTAFIETESGRKLTLEFDKATKEGANLIRRGNAFYSSPMMYSYDLNAAKDGIAGLNITDWNTHVLNILSDEKALEHQAAAALNNNGIMHQLDSGEIKNLQKILERSYHGSGVIEDLKNESLLRKLSLALGMTNRGESFVNPMNITQQLVNAGNIIPDVGNLYDISTNQAMKGFGSDKLSLHQIKSIYDNEGRSSSRIIKQTLQGTSSFLPEEIKFNGVSLSERASSGDQKAISIMNELNNYGGINTLVSQSQVAAGTRNLGGAIYNPAVTEGYKSLSSSSFVRPIGARQSVDGYRYGYRYGINDTTTRTGRLSSRLLNGTHSMTSFGFVDFLGEEGIYVNKTKASNFIHDTNIQVGIEGYTEEIGNRKLHIYNTETGKSLRQETIDIIKDIMGKDAFDQMSKGEKADLIDEFEQKYTFNDLYSMGDDSELAKLMRTKKYEIRFAGKSPIGVRSDARPIGGINDEFGVDVIGRNVQLKGTSIMGHEEFEAFLGLNKGSTLTGKVSIPLRLRSTSTKLALTATNQRASASYLNFSTRSDAYDSRNGLMDMVSKIHNMNVANDTEVLIGADLFKAVFPKDVLGSGILQTGKQHQEMMQTLHSMLLGEVDVNKRAGNNLDYILKGDIAKTFNKFLLNPQSNSSEINLTDLLYRGDAKFTIPTNNTKQYEEQLKNLLDVYREVRYRTANNITDKTIDGKFLAPEDYLTSAWAESKEFWESALINGTKDKDIAIESLRKHLWAISPQLSAMESVELSQGSKGFNTARFAMRDQFMSIGTSKTSIMHELLSRNDVDTKRLMMEQEMLRASHGSPEKMEAMTKNYKEYIKSVYGEEAANVYDAQLRLTTPESMRIDLEKSLGSSSLLDLKHIRENKEIATDTFLNEELNRFGKVIIGEDGRKIHFPSAQALGGMTVLQDGRVTFEGKDAANVPMFFDIARETITNSKLTNSSFNKVIPSFNNLANIILDNRAKIQIHAASYARNVYDKSLTNHDVMKLIEGRTGIFSNISSESRSVFGHMASISSKDASLMIQDEIMHAIYGVYQSMQDGKSKTLIESINEIKGSWIAEDHGDILAKVQKRIDEGKLLNIDGTLNSKAIHKTSKGASNLIVNRRMSKTDAIENELNNLLKNVHINSIKSPEELKTVTDRIAYLIEKTSIPLYALRDPNIYSGSESALHGFISKSLSYNGARDGGALVNKIMSVGFAAAANMAADQDGDKIKFLMLFSGKSREAAIETVKGSQRKSEELLSMAKERIKILTGRPDGKKQIFHFSDSQMGEVANQVFKQQDSSAIAAFVTKAYTGSANIAALGTKGELHKMIAHGDLNKDELETVLGFVNSIPSLMTEQQVISAKKLSNYIGTGVSDSKTPIETLVDNIGKLNQDQVIKMIGETGTVDPMLITQLGAISQNPAKKAQYSEAIDLANTILGWQTNYNKISKDQLEKFRPHLQGARTDSQWVEFVDTVMKHQENKQAFLETDIAKKISAPSGFIELMGKSNEATGLNPDKLIKGIVDKLKENNESLDDISTDKFWEMFHEQRSSAFRMSEELYGTGAESILSQPGRRIKGWNKAAEKVESVINWIKEAPGPRLGGLAVLGISAAAVMNLMSGSTIDSKDDIPSMNNPGMEHSPRAYGSTESISGSSSLNRSNSLLTSSNLSGRNSISSVNALVGNSGYHSVSIRNDNTNPYIDKMSYYN